MLHLIISIILFVILASMIGFAKVTGVSTGIKGKVGNTVYATWKGIQVLKTRAIPHNPKTSAQTTQRGFFSDVVQAFKPISTGWIRRFWNPFTSSSETGWNAFMKKNLLAMAGTFDFSDAILSYGTLHQLDELEASIVSATGVLSVSWVPTTGCNGDTADSVGIIVFDEQTKKVLYCVSNACARADESWDISLPEGTPNDSIVVYACASQIDENDNVTMVSTSQLVTVSAGA